MSVPDDATLVAGLRDVLGAPVTVLDRRRNPYASSVPSEVVTCDVAGRGELRVLCKYDLGLIGTCHGHRHGVGYEAHVYRAVLEALATTAPRCHGVHDEPGGARRWLVLEYLDETIRVNQSPDGEGIYAAARWIGAFHAATAELARSGADGLIRHDATYLRGWARRTRAYTAGHPLGGAWLERLCTRADDFVAPLLAAEPVIVHGELYPHNILLRHGRIVPVDWESAALSAGELDLASLTERWPAEIARRCELEYARARWPGGAPATFAPALAAARVYWPLRWLGDRPEWAHQERSRWRFAALEELACASA